MKLENKVAIVTGGTRGIGRAICLDLAKNGANVAFTYRKADEEAKTLTEEITKSGRKAAGFKTDVSNFNEAQDTVKKILTDFGRIDILVNNAGMNMDSTIWKMTEEQWDKVIGIDLKGTFNYCRAVSPILREQNSGKIVNVTSINGLRGKFGQTNYSAAKAGAIGLTKALAKELGKSSVNVNSVAPGMILTDMMEGLPQDIKDAAVNETVLKRLAKPEEVATVVTFLCTEEARHITGEVIKVDGGQYI